MKIFITILISTLALYSCAPKYKTINQLMDEEVQKTQNDCDKRFRSGEFKTESDKLKNCINPSFLRIAPKPSANIPLAQEDF